MANEKASGIEVGHLEAGTLVLGGEALLTGVPESVTVEADPTATGVFLTATFAEAQASHMLLIGKLAGLERFTCCHRYEPFWMVPMAGTRLSQTPPETQYLLASLTGGRCALIVPLLDGAFRACIQGTEVDELALVLETGDPAVVGDSATGLFVAVGDDPYVLIRAAAHSVMARMRTGRLRREKPLPSFVDMFGWCTWNAFYHEVSHDNVRTGLRSFADGGVQPGYLILDDGWQPAREYPTGERRMTGFDANDQFPDGLRATVAMAKEEFGLGEFFVWHTMQGYWGGLDGSAMKDYRTTPQRRRNSPGILHHRPGQDEAFGQVIDVVDPRDVHRFFNDYHRYLALRGVDGVKVDSQASMEAVAQTHGGRVELMRVYHEAIEGSAHTHFRGNLINCMSCANDMLYAALNSNVTRTSTDFWPNDPASHGLHLYTNAYVGLWFGEFVHPDWDMFQSGHEMGAYHAAGRAVGGCPVYVSDAPGAHDFDLLRKLVVSDGSVLRADEPGMPTRDCVFRDPTREDVLLKIFNRNQDAGVIGVFNARFHAEEAERVAISGTVSPSDVEGIEGERFAVYAHTTGELRECGRSDKLPVSLPELAWEVYTVMPVDEGVAPIGLADKLNSSGAITAAGDDGSGGYIVLLRDGGTFVAWTDARPSSVRVDDEETAFTYAAAGRRLTVEISQPGDHAVRIVR